MLRSLHFPQYVFPVASPHAASLISQPHPLLLTRIRLPAVSSRSSACFFPLHRVCFYPALAPHENILQHKTPLPFLCEKRDKLSALPPPPKAFSSAFGNLGGCLHTLPLPPTHLSTGWGCRPSPLPLLFQIHFCLETLLGLSGPSHHYLVIKTFSSQLL